MRNVGPAQIAILIIAGIAAFTLLAALAYALTRIIKKAWTKDDHKPRE